MTTVEKIDEGEKYENHQRNNLRGAVRHVYDIIIV